MPELKDRKVAHQLFGFDDIRELLRTQEPRKALRRLLTADGALRAGYLKNNSHAWYCAGCAHFDLGNYAQARSAFRKALQADCSNVQCLVAIGNCYEADGRPNLAEMAFRSALAMNPDRTTVAKLNLSLANALCDQESYIEALGLYKMLTRSRGEVGDRARVNVVRVLERLRRKSAIVAKLVR